MKKLMKYVYYFIKNVIFLKLSCKLIKVISLYILPSKFDKLF